jgi:hypothetical protein
MPDVDVVLMRQGKLLARMKTGADSRASARVSHGLVTISIHQTGYAPVEQFVYNTPDALPIFETSDSLRKPGPLSPALSFC